MNNDTTIIIGSGINSLTAGAVLARAGEKVLVLERNDWFGGNMRTQELTVPGFHHDVFSGFHPLFTTSPAWKELQEELQEHGLHYLNTDIPIGVLLPDGRSGVFYRDRKKTVEVLNAEEAGDGDAYQQSMQAFAERQQIVFGLMGKELWSWDGVKLGMKAGFSLGTEGLISFLGDALPSARKWLENNFKSEVTRGLFAPWVLHMGLGPEDAASGLMERLVLASLEQTGMPVPRGGGQRLADALVSLIQAHGGELRHSVDVQKIIVEDDKATGVVTDRGRMNARRVLANVTPTQLYFRLLKDSPVPEGVKTSTKQYCYGRGCMQLHFALSASPQWPDERLKQAAIVHITSGLNGVSRAVNEATRGLLPAEGTIVFGQHTALDPSRAPEGQWTVWIQLQELPNFPTGDALDEIEVNGEWTDEIANAYADRITERLDRQLPGFHDSILGRHVLSPADLANININLVDGDPYSGQGSLDQLFFWRPIPELRRHETPFKHLYHIGASTHPGPGLNGTSGYLVAKDIL